MNHLYIGLMSGTSLDGVDVALVTFEGDTPSCIAARTEPYPPSLRNALLELNQPGISIEQMMDLDLQLGRLYARQVRTLLETAGIAPHQVTAIGSHGHTIRHRPDKKYPSTLQIGDPNIIAHDTGITTIADFRRRDMAAGGQGAPLVPAFHQTVFQQEREERVIVNIGGISNITILPGNRNQVISGFDTGPGNVLLDGWAERHLQTPIDKDGAWAATGKVDTALLAEMLLDPFFHQPPPKSTGREYFNVAWLQTKTRINTLAPADVAATLCELTASCIATAIHQQAPETTRILVCGGGIHNNTLINLLKKLAAPATVESSMAYGIDPDWVEAIAFAWLARQTMNGQPGNLPSVTGADQPVVLGGIYRSTEEHPVAGKN